MAHQQSVWQAARATEAAELQQARQQLAGHFQARQEEELRLKRSSRDEAHQRTKELKQLRRQLLAAQGVPPQYGSNAGAYAV